MRMRGVIGFHYQPRRDLCVVRSHVEIGVGQEPPQSHPAGQPCLAWRLARGYGALKEEERCATPAAHLGCHHGNCPETEACNCHIPLMLMYFHNVGDCVQAVVVRGEADVNDSRSCRCCLGRSWPVSSQSEEVGILNYRSNRCRCRAHPHHLKLLLR
jgi:hypothetical protein